MKMFCYAVLAVIFLMNYQKNPIFTIVIVFIGIGGYLYFKSKKGRGSNSRSGFLSSRHPQQDDSMHNVVTLLMLQQSFNNDSDNNFLKSSKKEKQRNKEIDKVKNEILEILGETP
jgi:hypothetical protein